MERLYITTSSDLSARTATLISRDPTAFPKTRLCLWISSRKRRVMMMNNNNNNNNNNQGKEVRLQLRGQFIETTMAMAMKNEIRTEVCSTMKRPEFLTSKNSLKIQTSEDSPFELLQSLADMDITFTALKNPSNDVRRLVKQLVRKWKDLGDEYVKLNTPNQRVSSSLIDGSSGSDKNNSELEPKVKVVPRRDAPPAKPTHSIPLAASVLAR
ncbi:unnamed protein product [Camellia sinensis]